MDWVNAMKWVDVIGNFMWPVASMATLAIAIITARTLILQRPRPKVIVYTHHDYLRPGYLKIRIHNIGKDVAKDISFEMDPQIPDIKGPLLTELPSLGPGEYRESGWGVVWNLKKKTSGGTYKIKYKYHHGRKPIPGEDIIETDSYDEELTRLSPYKDIVKAIEEKLSAVEDKLSDISVLGKAWKEYTASRSCDDPKK